ncbi:4,5-DOPA dioxygenase extradiol [Flavobacterium sp. Fl-318]|uniref:4,5-DOPA dioxygenase extradiol n=2 Tax=Flavobacterium cupriresistens TaxID=2893885 RepID=A0ABU4R557_9FLAO|nr:MULTISPECIES: 4,5-DOPA dioxygenase extradiol [unclassified Flavobacterium]MDX6187731.1 4,5-DOPA dioxygenase extradiol [Flavobacterium sp. Fl-318]UFH42346.1 4,5-DOPA dioxygenase extradiol [Flavobacterium sp. F-323]
MDRKKFLKTMAIVPLTGVALKLNVLSKLSDQLESTEKMPLLFLGHGNPMNAIEDNVFVEGFKNVAKTLANPKAILCISAHWETKGTFVTAMEMPRTIHDFGGFPQALFDVQYPAKGSFELAKETQQLITKTQIELDYEWGLDHGSWSVVKHLYPNADIPIIQMSIDYSQPASYHYELAKELAALRRKGILIIGSGNMVHNLRMAAWDQMKAPGYAYEWATEANEKMKKLILDGDHQPLIDYRSQGKAFDLAIPTPEHYLPLLYTLALQEKNEEVSLFNDYLIAGSLNMMSLKIG